MSALYCNETGCDAVGYERLCPHIGVEAHSCAVLLRRLRREAGGDGCAVGWAQAVILCARQGEITRPHGGEGAVFLQGLMGAGRTPPAVP